MVKQLITLAGRACSPLLPFLKAASRARRLFLGGLYAPRFKRAGGGLLVEGPMRLSQGLEHVEVGRNVYIGANVQLTTWETGGRYRPIITIGDNAMIGDDCHITAVNSVSIGRNVLFGKKVLVTDNAHGAPGAGDADIHPNLRPLHSKGPVTIGDNAWIGEKASIMPGVAIGPGAVVGANSVVTRDVPPGAVVAGVPAKLIKTTR